MLAVSISLLTALVSTADARTDHRHIWRCRPHHPNLVAANKRAEIFEVGETEEGVLHPEHFDGCAYGSTHPYSLGLAHVIGSSSGVGGSDGYTLAGATAAYTEDFLDGPGEVEERWSVRVVDLRTGRMIHNVPSGTAPCQSASSWWIFGVGPVVALVLREDGAVAWIASDQEQACPLPAGTREVHALDSHGERVLSVGADIDPRSLTLVGSSIHWRQGGQAHAAPLD